MATFLSEIGAMRVVLLVFTLVVLLFAPFTGADPEGIGILAAYIVPTIALLLFFVLLLDLTMNRVFMVEQDAATAGVFRRRLRADLIAVARLVAVWGPFLYRWLALYTQD